MNTVKIGDEFEDKSFQIIEKIINGGKLGIFPELCTIKRKPRYPSHRRKNGIVFDLSIEVTLPNFDKPTLLYLIECKCYSSKIPVDDVALFGIISFIVGSVSAYDFIKTFNQALIFIILYGLTISIFVLLIFIGTRGLKSITDKWYLIFPYIFTSLILVYLLFNEFA